MIFSAAKLCKQSASAMLYDELKHRRTGIHHRKPTERQLAGNTYADAALGNEGREMGGGVRVGNHLVFFSVDKVEAGRLAVRLVEQKMATEKVEQWLKRAWAIQVAVYHALASSLEELRTSRFAIHQYGVHRVGIAGLKLNSVLRVNEIEYPIRVKRKKQLLDFVRAKCEAVASLDFDVTREFDAEWKRKEWERLKGAIVADPALHT